MHMCHGVTLSQLALNRTQPLLSHFCHKVSQPSHGHGSKEQCDRVVTRCVTPNLKLALIWDVTRDMMTRCWCGCTQESQVD